MERKIHDNLNLVSFMKLSATEDATINKTMEIIKAMSRIIICFLNPFPKGLWPQIYRLNRFIVTLSPKNCTFAHSFLAMRLFYNIGILVYAGLIRLISPFNIKAKLLAYGRKNWYNNLKGKIIPGEKYLWVHCASLGEFEQGRPVIESFKDKNPGIKIVLTFFSPSGYEVRKNYGYADIVCYLPADRPGNARKFIALVDPVAAIIVKYEFWRNFIEAADKNGTPIYLVSAIFRENQHFFKWYGGFFRNILKRFEKIFVQDDNSYRLLNSIGIKNVIVAGDTRFDRVLQIAGNAKEIPQLASFKGEERLFLCGSSWSGDEAIISGYINRYPEKMKWVFAPHEIGKANVDRLERLFKTKVVRFSAYNGESCDARVMIIDNIGMLSSAYRYAEIAAIGGGFGKGIHNILEAACWSIPVMFGPNHEKFREALEMKKVGGAVSFSNLEEFEQGVEKWLNNETEYNKAASAAGGYVKENAGATKTIIDGLK